MNVEKAHGYARRANGRALVRRIGNVALGPMRESTEMVFNNNDGDPEQIGVCGW